MFKGLLLYIFIALPAFGELLHKTDTLDIDVLWRFKGIHFEFESGNKTIVEGKILMALFMHAHQLACLGT